MGILNIFSAEGRRARRLDRAIRRANNKYTPKDYRQMALDEVIQAARNGSQPAMAGLISRFSVVAEPSIEDEREKETVCDTLVDLGEKALPQIKRALRTAESVNWVQRVFKRIVSQDDYKTELLDILTSFDTEYERNPDRKIQTIMALGETSGTEVPEQLIRFLSDVDETVRFQTVVALAKLGDEKAREPLLQTMCEDDSLRVRNEAIDAFSTLGWATTGCKKKVELILPDGYKQEKSGKILKLKAL